MEIKDDGKLGGPQRKLEDSKRKIGHHVYNGTRWVRQQAEHHPAEYEEPLAPARQRQGVLRGQ